MSTISGIVDAQEKWPLRLLTLSSWVEEHSDLVASQLKEKDVRKLVFYTVSEHKDPNIKPYIDCIKFCVWKNGTVLEIRELV